MMQEDDFVTIRLTVNGVTHHLVVEPRRLLADVLREDLGLTGTNIGCEHGVWFLYRAGGWTKCALVPDVRCAGQRPRSNDGGRLIPHWRDASTPEGFLGATRPAM